MISLEREAGPTRAQTSSHSAPWDPPWLFRPLALTQATQPVLGAAGALPPVPKLCPSCPQALPSCSRASVSNSQWAALAWYRTQISLWHAHALRCAFLQKIQLQYTISSCMHLEIRLFSFARVAQQTSSLPTGFTSRHHCQRFCVARWHQPKLWAKQGCRKWE